METLKTFQDTIDTENKEIIDLYNSIKSKKLNGKDVVDAEIVKELSPEDVLSA